MQMNFLGDIGPILESPFPWDVCETGNLDVMYLQVNANMI